MYKKVVWIVFLLFTVQVSFATGRYPSPTKLRKGVSKAMKRAGGETALANRAWQQMELLHYLPTAEEGIEVFDKTLREAARTHPDGFNVGNFVRDISLLAYTDEDTLPFLLECHQEAKGTYLEPVIERVYGLSALRYNKRKELAEFMQAEGVNQSSLLAEAVAGTSWAERDANAQFWQNIERLARERYGQQWADDYQASHPLGATDIIGEDIPSRMFSAQLFPHSSYRVVWLEPWVRSRGALARSLADLSGESIALWLGKPQIFTQRDLTEYAGEMLADKNLQLIEKNHGFSSLSLQEFVNRFLQTEETEDRAKALKARYDALLAHAGSILRGVRKLSASLHKNPTQLLNDEQFAELESDASAILTELKIFREDYFLDEVPPAMEKATEVLEKAVFFLEGGAELVKEAGFEEDSISTTDDL